MHSVVYCEYTAKVGDSIMKSLYDAARHLVWLTQFGLSVVIPPVVCIIGAVWLRRQLQLGGWIVGVGVAIGVLAAVSCLRSSLQALDRQGKTADPGRLQLR